MYREAAQPKQLALFAGDLIGDALLQGSPRAEKTLLAFLAAHG